MNSPAALKMIRDEHAALATLLRAMATMVTDARRRGRQPDFGALRAMLFYVDEFPERLHHVKETGMLFVRLRELMSAPTSLRASPSRRRSIAVGVAGRSVEAQANAVLDRLDREHAQGEGRIRDLAHRLTAWELLGESRREPFERALDSYVAFYLEHMRIEEAEVLPLAERVLGDDDWRMLERAFGMHRDALTGAEPEALYAGLFRRIVDAMR